MRRMNRPLSMASSRMRTVELFERNNVVSATIPPGLFVAEGHDRGQAGGPGGGVAAEEDPDQHRDAERQCHRAGGDDGLDGGDAEVTDADADRGADQPD